MFPKIAPVGLSFGSLVLLHSPSLCLQTHTQHCQRRGLQFSHSQRGRNFEVLWEWMTITINHMQQHTSDDKCSLINRKCTATRKKKTLQRRDRYWETLNSQEGVDLFVEDHSQAEDDANVSHKGEQGQVLQVSYPGEHHHREDQDGYPRLLANGHIQGLTEHLICWAKDKAPTRHSYVNWGWGQPTRLLYIFNRQGLPYHTTRR